MVNKLTIGAIWISKKTNKQYELVGVNKENGKVQLSSTGNGDQEYFVMTQASLRKNYRLVCLKPVEITNVLTEIKKTNSPARIQLEDGRVIKCINFLREVAGISESEACGKYPSDAGYWLKTTKKGKEILERHNAKIVYGKPLNK